MRYLWPFIVTLYLAPLGSVVVVPNFQAHLSVFSMPRQSYQALRSGSVTASSSSWATTLTMASPAGLLFGDAAVCPAQAARFLLASPTTWVMSAGVGLLSQPPYRMA